MVINLQILYIFSVYFYHMISIYDDGDFNDSADDADDDDDDDDTDAAADGMVWVQRTWPLTFDLHLALTSDLVVRAEDHCQKASSLPYNARHSQPTSKQHQRNTAWRFFSLSEHTFFITGHISEGGGVLYIEVYNLLRHTEHHQSGS